MAVTCAEMKAAEDALFASGRVTAEQLMEEAGLGCARAIGQFFPRPAAAILYVGRGHNGGDALVIGRYLRQAGWNVTARLAYPVDQLAPLTKKKWDELEATPTPVADLLERRAIVLVDGLLGIGAKGPMRPELAALAAEMNRLRLEAGATCFAVDLPSGLDGDTGEPTPGAVIADITLTIAVVKRGLIADAALDHVGRLAVIQLPELRMDGGGVLTGHALGRLMPPAPFSHHKAAAGRVGIIAGARGYLGAAVLSSTGALRAGAGLVTLYVKESVYAQVTAMVCPEVMVKPVTDYRIALEDNLDAVAIGPGLTTSPTEEVLELIENDPRPMIVDADALNILATSMETLNSSRGPRLVTPHPGEIRRLFPDLNPKWSRLETARAFVERYPHCTLLYKGSRTLILANGQNPSFNTTGDPGMATGGIGDVLTGVCAALAATRDNVREPAELGSWLIGRAAEIVRWTRDTAPEGLTAGDVANALPEAIQSLHRRDF